MSARDALLVLNLGSSSVKFSVFAAEAALPLLLNGQITGLGTGQPALHVGAQPPEILDPDMDLVSATERVLDLLQARASEWRLLAAGHRIVHGGEAYSEPVRLTASVLTELERYVPLAPLHQQHNLAGVHALARRYPRLPQIGCFDTAFHAGHDRVTRSYALPASLREQGIRRYGFHGLSYEWVAAVLAAESETPPERVVVAHLGNGASLCALRGLKSVDTSMGMTALEGLPMGTRCGALDPGAVLYMLRDLRLSVDEVERLLHDESGLKGLSGGLSDMRELLASASPHAAMAVDYFVLRTAQKMAEMVVSLGGLDLLVFTGGIGEHAATVRARIVQRLAFLPGFAVRVIAADEARMIGRHTLRLIE